MVNQALRMKITDWSEKEEEKEENTRDRSVPDGSNNKNNFLLVSFYSKGHCEPKHNHIINM